MVDIAVVGMSCYYPDARSPQELWENVLAQRQAFRRFPPERLRLEDYFCQDANVPDTTYAAQGAFITNYEFDRVRFRISGNAYRSSDLAHWLALDIASQALADAGFTTAASLPTLTTRVIVGNTLTGEFSRANGLRLRWPYMRRVVEAALREEGWSTEQCLPFLTRLETRYKAPFAPVGEETLAGGLSNTIAGRICNYFNFRGGGYTIDGACASSLLAIATACIALADGDIDLALAGGVDLSLDPFELIGFAKTSALAAEEMRVYDRGSNGFIPGEGCGFVTLMRYDDALAQQRRIYALVRGWGISSDGSGGITRPEVEGQILALTRAYQKAAVGIDTVEYFEGHGTGTSVGDLAELQTITRARQQTQRPLPPATIGSTKTNIGHTKAAAGVASFIKTVMALSTQLLPPIAGTKQPHPALLHEQAPLVVRNTGTIWPAHRPLRAGVSAMGFGGINTHLVLEGATDRRRMTVTKQEQVLLASSQDVELFLFAAHSAEELRQQLAHLFTFAARLSRAEMTDLSLHLIRTLPAGTVRAALVAANPTELAQRIERLLTLLKEQEHDVFDVRGGIFFGQASRPPRVGFLFTGQGSPAYLQGGALRRRFDFVRELYARANLAEIADEKDTVVAQPAIVTASMAALRMLARLGITAEVGLGHSLGELTALHWAGAFDEETLLQFAKARGEAMGSLGNPTGTMVSLQAPRERVEQLLQGESVVIAGINAPNQTVIAGDKIAIASVVARANAAQIPVVPLKVSHAFHSPLVAAAVLPLATYLENLVFHPLQRTVISTVTGSRLEPEQDLKALLCQQIVAPVNFVDAVREAATQVDLLIEVGPGKALSTLARESTSLPAFSIDTDSPSMKGFCQVVGAAFAAGIPLHVELLAENRFSRPFELDWRPRFFTNPCEQAPLSDIDFAAVLPEEQNMLERSGRPDGETAALSNEPSSPLNLLRQLVAERSELPIQAVEDHHRMLSDLHLNSITVGQIVSEAARALGLLPPTALTEYADATLSEIAQALVELQQTGSTLEQAEHMNNPLGIDTWIRAFQVRYIEQPPAPRQARDQAQEHANWKIFAPPDYPLANALQRASKNLLGDGVLVCLPPGLQKASLSLILQGTQEVFKNAKPSYFVLVQHASGGAGVARTLAQEAPQHTVCVVDVPLTHPQAVEWILAEIQMARGYHEVIYDEQGKRQVAVLQLLPQVATRNDLLSPGPEDVLLVTGGGKGIAAECAFSLARETGVRLALLGRSQPSQDTELAENLQRFAAAQITFRYISTDVTNLTEVRRAVSEIEEMFGSITLLLHGAGANTPKLLTALTEEEFARTLGPKVDGLQHILASVNPAKLRLLLTFGSVIARTGMRGEADYALANDWLAILTERFQAEHPSCRCLCLEWSVWAGLGMGERLGRIEALMREGITPIPVDKGIACFRSLLAQHVPSTRVLVTSRFGTMPTLHLHTPELPFLRFLENPRIYYPGIELITDVELSIATDPYLEDHKFRGERLLPAVVGLEAMAQLALAVTGNPQPPRFEHVQLMRPIVVPERGNLKIRLAALVNEAGEVTATIQSEETGFQVDHFRATCHFAPPIVEQFYDFPDGILEKQAPLPLDPRRDLYGTILFHEGSFQRLHAYHHLQADECIAEITVPLDEKPFAHYLPNELVLGSFLARDAVIHCIQACIPHKRLLPVAIEKVSFVSSGQDKAQRYFVYAKEWSRVGDLFTYGVEVRTDKGQLCEQWKGLQLLQVEALQPQTTWSEALLVPYLERVFNEFFPATPLHLAIQRRASKDQQESSNLAFQHLLGASVSVQRRGDGKPFLVEQLSSLRNLSASHHADLTLAVVSPHAVGCDMEAIVHRSSQLWQDLLSPERFRLATFLVSQTGEDLDTVGTRLWVASECLKKVGAMVNVALRFHEQKEHGWLLLQAGSFFIATYTTRVRNEEMPLVFALCSTAKAHLESERVIQPSILTYKEKKSASL